MKWTEETIKNEILKLATKLNIQRMPTNTEMRKNKMSGLSRAIGLNGGTKMWSEITGLPMKKPRKKWTDELIEREIKKSLGVLQISRMPSSSELESIGRVDLQNAISKNGGFRRWSERLNLTLNNSASSKGQNYELKVKKWLMSLGHEVMLMSSGHPYDLLVNNNVKIDVKVGAAHHHFGSRSHTFRPSSKHSTCDIYICVALDETEEVENTFIIPSKFAQVQTLNIGTNSKYDVFINRWEFVKEYTDFYDSIEFEGAAT